MCVLSVAIERERKNCATWKHNSAHFSLLGGRCGYAASGWAGKPTFKPVGFKPFCSVLKTVADPPFPLYLDKEAWQNARKRINIIDIMAW